jgi:hypothetical protein
MDEPLIFLSYASPDRDQVLEHYEWLSRAGHNVWLDQKHILPGQEWDLVINQALDRAALVIAFVSTNSVQRRGYVQREIRRALDRRLEQLADDIFLIPVLLDAVELPSELRQFQAVRTTTPNYQSKILAALRTQLERLGHKVQQIQEARQISWTRRTVSERSKGKPASEVSLELLDFTSETFPEVRYVGEYLRGQLLDVLYDVRLMTLQTSPDDEWRRNGTSEVEVAFRDPEFRGRFVSLQGTALYYYAGAAHGGMNFITATYLLQPFLRVPNLTTLFVESSVSFGRLQSMIRVALLNINMAEEGAEPIWLERDWVERGTESPSDFASFTLGEKAITLYFPPYQVGPYAVGPQIVDLPYAELRLILRPEMLDALQLSAAG